MKNYFQGTSDTPHHISIGAVLINEEGEVACHYFDKNLSDKYPLGLYSLMHESIEPHESLEGALARGLKEEFSATAELIRYVGSLVVYYEHKGVPIEKTVLYFLCKLIDISEVRDMSDLEAKSEIRWVDIDDLIPIMKEQGKIDNAVDESKIFEETKAYIDDLRLKRS